MSYFNLYTIMVLIATVWQIQTTAKVKFTPVSEFTDIASDFRVQRCKKWDAMMRAGLFVKNNGK